MLADSNRKELSKHLLNFHRQQTLQSRQSESSKRNEKLISSSYGASTVFFFNKKKIFIYVGSNKRKFRAEMIYFSISDFQLSIVCTHTLRVFTNTHTHTRWRLGVYYFSQQRPFLLFWKESFCLLHAREKENSKHFSCFAARSTIIMNNENFHLWMLGFSRRPFPQAAALSRSNLKNY